MTSEERKKYEETAVEMIRLMAIGAEYDLAYIPPEKYVEICLSLNSGRESTVYIFIDTYRENETIELNQSILELWGNKQYIGVQQMLEVLTKMGFLMRKSALTYIIKNTELMNAFSKIRVEKEKLIEQFILKAAKSTWK